MMRYKIVLTSIAILTAFLLPTQVIKLKADGIPTNTVKSAPVIQPISTALTPKPTITLAEVQKPASTPTIAPHTVSGNKAEWLAASGIPSNLWGYVDWLVSRESGWDPCAYNPRQSNCNANPTTACGLVQQYPCHKIPGDWRDPVAALKWQYGYVTNKFGGYPQAVAYWQANGNY